jgi:nucleotide-binding universal stress UspA family protein
MLRRILVGLDGSPLAETILDPVRSLAGRLGAELVLLHVTHVPEDVRTASGDGDLDEMVMQERARARTYLEGVVQRIGGRAVRTALSVGDAASEIVRSAERERIDLVALATHGRSGLQRWLYGSVADAVLHATTTPLLLLRPPATGAAPHALRRIVVPLDGSPLAEAALHVAAELGRALAVPLVLLRVIEFTRLAFAADQFGSPYLDYKGILDVLRRDAEQYLARVAADVRAEGLVVEARTSIGVPADAITAHAREHAGSLVVLGTHGRTGWRALVLGSVARRVVLLAEAPVLVVRPPRPEGAS